MIPAVDLVEEVVRRARRAGADEAEAYFEDRQATSIEVREQEVETLASASTRGLGLRVLVGGAAAYVYSPDLRPRGLVELARRAVALAREAAPDPDRHLPELVAPPSGADLKIFDPRLAEVSPERKIELLQRIEQAARAEDERVRSTEIARYSDQFGAIALANSRGFAARYERSYASAILTVVARQDSIALSGYGYAAGHGIDDLSPDEIGQQAARRAVKPLGGGPLPTQKATIVMESEVAAGFIGQVALALSGDAVLKGRSMFSGRLGERIGSELVTLIDRSDLAGGLASAPFDGEGVASGETLLVERGALRGFLHNTYTARRSGATSTANGVRPSYRVGPEVGPTNFSLAAASVPRDLLLRDVQRGLLVTTTRNVGGINPVNGDYSVGAAGVWLENGQEAAPVAGVTIAANMLEMLAGLVAVADDFRWSPGGGAFGCGSLRIEGMTIAGA